MNNVIRDFSEVLFPQACLVSVHDDFIDLISRTVDNEIDAHVAMTVCEFAHYRVHE
jgi:hypothetical protein